MKFFCFLLLLYVGIFPLKAAENVTGCPIIPPPQSYHSSGRKIILPENNKAFIVIAGKADETVRYAAERFKTSLKRLTGHDYRITDVIPPAAQLVFLFGIPENDPAVADFCRQYELVTTPGSWGNDGFLIHFGKIQDTQTVCVAAGIPRGVIYGQEALTALLTKHNDVCQLTEASVRDYAQIKWRSFVWNQNRQYLQEGVLDAYADARINSIELRDGVKETMYGQFGFPVQYEITGVEESKVIREAHRRGMFVWGVVSCGVKAGEENKVIAHYEKLIKLGVDGLYISFDDPGHFTNGVDLIKMIMALAKEHEFDYDQISYLPPLPHYGRFYSDFNQKLLKEIPELARVRWVLTTAPTNGNQLLFEDLGITRPRSFWFNWPMGGKSEWRSPGCMRAYRPVPQLDDTYGYVANEWMRNAAKRIDTVMVFVRGTPEYLAQLSSCWAWRPDTYDQILLRKRIYTRVFGPESVAAAMQFDDFMTDLKDMFSIVGPWDWAQHCWVLRLPEQRPHARQILKHLKSLQAQIAAKAPQGTWLSQRELSDILNRMTTTVKWFDALVEFDFPEYIHPNYVRDFKWERDVKKRGPKYLAHWTKKLEPKLKEIERKFGHIKYTGEYVKMWRKRLSGDIGDGSKVSSGAAEY